LEVVEADPMVQLTIRSLVDLSQYRLTTAAHSLMTLLENVNKVDRDTLIYNYIITDIMRAIQSISLINDDGPSIDTLQSQLLILKVLGACMSHHWRCHREAQRERTRAATTATGNFTDTNDSNNSNNTSHNNNGTPVPPHSASSTQSFRKRSESDVAMHSVMVPTSDSGSSVSNIGTSSHGSHTHSARSYTMMGGELPAGLDTFDSVRGNPSRQSSETVAAQAHSTYEDPPPLEDPLAKYIFHVVSSFLQNTSPDVYDAHAAAGGAALAAAMVDNPNIYGQSSHNANASSSANANDGVTSPIATTHGSSAGIGRDFLTSTYAALADAPADLAYEIHRAAGRVLFYISASNWGVVFARLKARIAVLAQTIDENADTGEVRLLEWCNLNSRRLSMVLQG
jgi:neurofibromin 1